MDASMTQTLSAASDSCPNETPIMGNRCRPRRTVGHDCRPLLADATANVLNPSRRLAFRQRSRKLGCERWSVIHKHIATSKSAVAAEESSPAESPMTHFAGLSVHASDCDT
jgi:hypothetical protein